VVTTSSQFSVTTVSSYRSNTVWHTFLGFFTCLGVHSVTVVLVQIGVGVLVVNVVVVFVGEVALVEEAGPEQIQWEEGQ